MKTIVGLDLGQVSDYSALAIVRTGGVDAKSRTVWHIPHLQRWPLSTPYVQIVQDVAALVRKLDKPALVIDRTGCGAPVFDMFAAAELAVADLSGVVITGGSQSTRAGPDTFHVAKRDLAGIVRTVWESGRVKIAKELPEAAEMVHELQTFTVKINVATGNESFEAWREKDKDDLVLASAMALWYAEAVPEVNWNIYHFRLDGSGAPPSPERHLPEVRWHSSGTWQPMPRPGGELVSGCPGFQSEAEAGWFTYCLHQQLGSTLPDMDIALAPDVANRIEQQVKDFITARRLARV